MSQFYKLLPKAPIIKIADFPENPIFEKYVDYGVTWAVALFGGSFGTTTANHIVVSLSENRDVTQTWGKIKYGFCESFIRGMIHGYIWPISIPWITLTFIAAPLFYPDKRHPYLYVYHKHLNNASTKDSYFRRYEYWK